VPGLQPTEDDNKIIAAMKALVLMPADGPFGPLAPQDRRPLLDCWGSQPADDDPLPTLRRLRFFSLI